MAFLYGPSKTSFIKAITRIIDLHASVSTTQNIKLHL